MTCHSRFSTHDGVEIRVYLEWTSQLYVALCRGCHAAATAMGFDLRIT